MKNRLMLLCMFCVCLASGVQAAGPGSQDRELWVKYLYKIAYPVIHNLAEGTLRANMPVEAGAGFGGDPRDVTYLETVGRTLAGVAPWLALPDDGTEEGSLRRELREEALEGLKRAIDPAQPDCLDFAKQYQPVVDAAYLAHAFLRAPKALWEPLDDNTKQRYIEAFRSLRKRTPVYNNHLLFAGITEVFLLKIGAQADEARIAFARNKFKEWYVGDGWYSDGPKFSMDYYNDYVIHPMLVDMLGVLLGKGKAGKQEYEQALRRMVRHSEFSERMITADGKFPVFGRSAIYRSGVFQTLSQVALMEKLPTHIRPAQVRCGLTAVFRTLYEGNQNFDHNGWLVLGLNGHQPELADYYSTTGSLYMATLGFLALGLPADHPFWTDAPADWTAKKVWNGEKVRKDYAVGY